MFYLKHIKREIYYFFIDHKITKNITSYGYMFVMCILSALLFAIGFRSFISLDENIYSSFIALNESNVIQHIATGGMSGLSQCVIIICRAGGLNIDYNTLQSIFYFVLNIPFLAFSFWKLGFKFSLFTTFNVIFSSIFIQVLPSTSLETIQLIENEICGGNICENMSALTEMYYSQFSIFDQIGYLLRDQGLARGIFAGFMTGLSIGIAFVSNHCTGSIDIIAYYYSTKKSTTTGKYMSLFNGLIILSFTILSITLDGTNAAQAIVSACFSIVYLFFSSLVIDTINVRNKKVQLQIVSSNETLARAIVANVPHSCTIVKAKGGYTGRDRYIIYVVVSNNEVTKLVAHIRKADPNTFINAINLRQVYGRFFVKPVE